MAKKNDEKQGGALIAVEPRHEVTVLPPNSGVVGKFIAEDREHVQGQSNENVRSVAENQ